MNRLVIPGLVVALLAASCGGGDTQGRSERPGENLTEQPGVPGGEPPLTASPEIPEPGAPLGVESRVEATGIATTENPFPPAVLLARTPQEAERAARRMPPEAAAQIRARNYGERGYLVVLGGTTRDRRRITVREVHLLKEGKLLVVFARAEPTGEAAQELATPWAVVSLRIGATVLATHCRVSLEGSVTQEDRCP